MVLVTLVQYTIEMVNGYWSANNQLLTDLSLNLLCKVRCHFLTRSHSNYVNNNKRTCNTGSKTKGTIKTANLPK